MEGPVVGAGLPFVRLPLLAFWLLTAKEALPVRRPFSHRRCAISGRGLLTSRNVIEPNATHAGRREKCRRHDLVATRLGLCRLRLRFYRNWTLRFRRARRNGEADSGGQRKPHPGTSRNGNHGRIGCTGGARPCQKSYLFATKRVMAC